MSNKILIIDDNIVFCNAVKYHLLDNEYDVDYCTSFNELNNKVDIKNYDIVLLDMKLKDAVGIDILQYILKENPEKKVIVVSSYLDPQSMNKVKELGAFTCVSKNSNLFKELDRIIKECNDP